MRIIPWNILGAILGAGLCAPAATIVLYDGTFSNSDWTSTVVTQVGSMSGSATQIGSGGNPGTYRQTTLSWPRVPSPSQHSMTIAHFGPLTFDPSTTGGIQQIDIEFDVAWISGPPTYSTTGYYRPYIQQAGNWFVYQPKSASADSTTWVSHLLTSTSANDWGPVIGFGSGLPDFSSSGAPITFGYRVLFNLNCPSGFSHCVPRSLVSGIDNFKVTITTIDRAADPPADLPTDVPEPTTAALGSIGLIGAALLSRRRRSDRRLY